MGHHSVEMGMFLRETGSGRPILWIHGLGESGLCFETIVGHGDLQGFRHLLPDLPGYGRSPWPQVPWTFPEAADLLASWLEARQEPPVLVAGHSLGGVLALILASRHPDLVCGVVDIDGNVTADDCTFSAVAAAWTEDEVNQGTGFRQLREQVFAQGAESPAARGYYASLRFADPASFLAHSRELTAISASGEVSGLLASLPQPVIYLAGSPGGASPATIAKLARLGTTCRLIQDSGHWPFIDQPDLFARIMRDFASTF